MRTQQPFGKASKTTATTPSPGLQALKDRLAAMTPKQKAQVQNKAVRMHGRGWSRVDPRDAQFAADLRAMESSLNESGEWLDVAGAPQGL